MTSILKVGLGTPHTSPKVRVEWEHFLVFARFRALYSKFEGKVGSSVRQSLLVQPLQGAELPTIYQIDKAH